MNLSEQIADLVTVPDILRAYGYNLSRSKRIPCPIHGGKDSNFCYTDKVFHCWTCGASGNAIKLVMQIFGLNFGQALVRINSDFRLGLTPEKPNAKSVAMAKEEARIRSAWKEYCQLRRIIYLLISDTHAELMRLGAGKEDLEPIENWLDDNLGRWANG